MKLHAGGVIQGRRTRGVVPVDFVASCFFLCAESRRGPHPAARCASTSSIPVGPSPMSADSMSVQEPLSGCWDACRIPPPSIPCQGLPRLRESVFSMPRPRGGSNYIPDGAIFALFVPKARAGETTHMLPLLPLTVRRRSPSFSMPPLVDPREPPRLASASISPPPRESRRKRLRSPVVPRIGVPRGAVPPLLPLGDEDIDELLRLPPLASPESSSRGRPPR